MKNFRLLFMQKIKIILFSAVLLFGLPLSGLAQFTDSGPFEVGIFGGVSTYNGDLQEMTFSYKQSHAAFGVFLAKEIHNGFGLEFGVNFGKLSGADSLSSDSSRALRNLDFQSNILDVHLLITYNFLHNMDTRIKPYAFVGVAVYHFDPYTYYSNDSIAHQRMYLQPLRTEGQGLVGYPDREPYSLTQFSIPFGIGVKYALSPLVNIGAVISMRKTFTDYIDDVSRTYVDFNTLHSSQPYSAELAFRTDEIPGHESDPYPADETLRGNEDANDFYFFTGLKISINLRSKTAAQRRALEQVACPPSY